MNSHNELKYSYDVRRILEKQAESQRYDLAIQHNNVITDSFDLAIILSVLPESKRLDFATLHADHLTFSHGFENMVWSLPEAQRLAFAERYIHKLDNVYVFSIVICALPQEHRLNFINQFYTSLYPISQRKNNVLNLILRELYAHDRLHFATQHRDEITSDMYLGNVLETLSPNDTLSFANFFLDKIVFGAYIGLVLSTLPENERLTYFQRCECLYLNADELGGLLRLLPASQHASARKINYKRFLSNMLKYRPIYDALGDAFNFIETSFKQDEEKKLAYDDLAKTLSQSNSIDIKPYQKEVDFKHIYFRNLESQAVDSVVKRHLPDSTLRNMISEYSGHSFDLLQSKIRSEEVKSCAENKLTWQDVLYLHENTLGLRAVTNDDEAITEAKNGGIGDAISLANFGRHRADHSDGDWNMRVERQALLDEKAMDKHYPQEKQTVLNDFEAGIKAHLKNSFCFGPSPAYELISRGDDALIPYDFKWYPLGKCGRRTFSSDQIKAIIVRNDAVDWNVESVYPVIVTTIKRMSGSINVRPAPQSKQYNPTLFASSPVNQPTSHNMTEEVESKMHHRCVIL